MARVHKVMRTRDGKWRVYLYDDHSAELSDGNGQLVTGRMPLYKVGQKLAERGVDPDELVED